MWQVNIALIEIKQRLKNLSYMARKVKDTDKAIKRLVEYFNSLGYQVNFNDNDVNGSECDPGTLTITINEKPGLNRLYTLLHEGGHALIFALDDYTDHFGEIMAQHKRPVNKQSRIYHYQVLKEELLAWEYGLNVARKLNIYVDEVDYDRVASKCFMTYCYRASQQHYQRAVKNISNELGVEIKFDNYA